MEMETGAQRLYLLQSYNQCDAIYKLLKKKSMDKQDNRQLE
jgi:hypothetical protein